MDNQANQSSLPPEQNAGYAPGQPADTMPVDLESEPVPEGAVTEDELEQMRAEEVAFSWQASEYVHHIKGAGWYAALFGITAVLVIVMAVLKFWLTIALFLVMAGAIVVYARKPPRLLTYELTPEGITIEGKVYPYAYFRSFTVFSDANWHSIELEPSRRFMPPISLLFQEQDFEAIVSHLELHLPLIDREPDMIEKLTRYVRF